MASIDWRIGLYACCADRLLVLFFTECAILCWLYSYVWLRILKGAAIFPGYSVLQTAGTNKLSLIVDCQFAKPTSVSVVRLLFFSAGKTANRQITSHRNSMGKKMDAVAVVHLVLERSINAVHTATAGHFGLLSRRGHHFNVTNYANKRLPMTDDVAGKRSRVAG